MTDPTSTAIFDASAPPAEERAIIGEEIFYGPRSSAGMTVTERTALQLPVMLAVVNVLATDVAALPCRVYQQKPDGSRELMAGHRVDDLLNVSPDGETTPIKWRQSWMLHALLYRRGLAEIRQTGRGEAFSLHLCDPELTKPYRDPTTRNLFYRLSNGESRPASKMLHLSGLGFDGVDGFSFVELLREAIGIGLAEGSFAADFFANGSEPGGVIETPVKLGTEGRKTLRDGWQARHKGPGKRFGLAVLEQGAKYSQISTDPEKAQLLESRRYQVLECARPFRVPPHKVGDYSQSHLANLEQSNLDYLTTALMPWLVAIEQECLLKLFTPAERKAGYYVEHTVAALLRGDITARYNAYGIAVDKGWLNRNEVRAMENLSPIADGGEKYTIQLAQTTLDKVGQDPTATSSDPTSTPPASSTDEPPPDEKDTSNDDEDQTAES